MNTTSPEAEKPHTYAESGVHDPNEQRVNTRRGEVNTPLPSDEQDERVHGLFTEEMNTENDLSMQNGVGKGEPVHVFTPFTPSEGVPLLDKEEEL